MKDLRSRARVSVPRWSGRVLPPRDEVASALSVPFAAHVSPHAQLAHDHTRVWLERFTVHQESAWVRRAVASRMAWFVAGFYPDANAPALCIASDYIVWAFGLDDTGDETAVGQRPERLIELFDQFEEVFLGRGSPRHATAQALADIVERIAALTTPAQMRAFHDGNRAYFGAMLWEANNRHAAIVPDETTYRMLRPAAGAAPPFFALIEPLQRVALDEPARTSPELARMARLAGEIMCWINDTLSYDKERAQGDVHNLALVYEHHRGLSPARALAEAVGFSNASVADFLDAERELPSFGAEQDREVARYAATLRSMIRVTLDWTLGSRRYTDAG